MSTIVIKSNIALSAPLPGTPVMPTYDPSLMATYDASSMEVSGNVLTKWKNRQGALGTAADLLPAKPQFPVIVDGGDAVFSGRTDETYLDSAVFPSALSVSKATFIARVRFGADSDLVANTVFSSTSATAFTFLRRNNGSRLLTGGSAPGPYVNGDIDTPNAEWMVVALVIDDGAAKIYVNDAYSQGETARVAALPSLRLGANNAGVNRLVGRISHLRIYNRAIALDELKEIRASM